MAETRHLILGVSAASIELIQQLSWSMIKPQSRGRSPVKDASPQSVGAIWGIPLVPDASKEEWLVSIMEGSHRV
ncbi:hypothetical protein N7470_000444 [Penicillium chermesinum]|nr:hypothetical protein N7470_000444 [Penicillium chermesinum]